MPLIITSPRLPRLLLLRLLLQLPYGTRMKRLPPCREMVISGVPHQVRWWMRSW